VVIDGLARGLTRLGHDVLLVCHPESTCPVERVSVIPAADAGRMGRASIELEHAVGAYEYVEECDVVHDHTLAGPLYSIRYPKLPVVATVHMPFGRTNQAVFGASVPRVALVAISNSHARGASIPIDAVVHHGVDIDDFPYGDGSGGFLAVLGRMTPEKGIDRAIDIARQAGMPLRIGAKMREPHEQAYFESNIAPLLGGEIEYLGELNATEKLSLLTEAVALLNPINWEEPFGMSMIESMACGTPVIGSPRGAAPELVDDGVTGFLRNTNDELAESIDHLDKLDRSACRARVRDHFSIEKMAKGYLEVYEAKRQAVTGDW
jgi:glycosyltransferase involved in cell wall biosynthesis